jgi:two-component system, NtrC family, sensor histidine kinase KinB
MAVPARTICPDDESLASLALEGIPAGVLVLDPSGRVLFASGRAAKLMGGGVENVTSDTATSDDFPRRDVFNQLCKACETWSPVSRLVTFDRECRHYILVSASPLPENGGERRMAVLLMDLTDVVAQGDMAKEFVRQVRHDLRSPLTSVRGAVDLLLSERLGTLDEKQKKLVVLVEKAAHSMTAIVSGGPAQAVSGTGQEGGQGGGK